MFSYWNTSGSWREIIKRLYPLALDSGGIVSSALEVLHAKGLHLVPLSGRPVLDATTVAPHLGRVNGQMHEGGSGGDALNMCIV